MGMRSTFTTDHYGIKWPVWLGERYHWVRVPETGKGPLSSMWEIKRVYEGHNFYADIQQILKDNGWANKCEISMNLVWLNEEGSTSVVEIFVDKIVHHDDVYFQGRYRKSAEAKEIGK